MKERCADCRCWTREGRPGTGVCHYSPLNNPVKGEGDWCIEGFAPIAELLLNVTPPTDPVVISDKTVVSLEDQKVFMQKIEAAKKKPERKKK